MRSPRRSRKRVGFCCAARFVFAAQLAAFALGASGCRAAAQPKAAAVAPAEQGRAQAKLDDRLRRLENRLELTQAQLLVMREQLRQVENGAARPPCEPPRAKLLRLHGNGAEGTNSAPWPVEQRILTDKWGRTRLVSAAEADAAVRAPTNVAPARPRPASGPAHGAR